MCGESRTHGVERGKTWRSLQRVTYRYKDVTANDEAEFRDLLQDPTVAHIYVANDLDATFIVERSVTITGLDKNGGKFTIKKLIIANPDHDVNIINLDITDLETGAFM
ncbi:hypothetical protein [Brevibacillus borstelensis]|uniref:hypothetical protein n=1 Tax=Brevibacillus borstelensis TaxID=45462 RepID=UPI002E244BCE|nr:hypothetical protein [Brevibacillus borstelensis]